MLTSTVGPKLILDGFVRRKSGLDSWGNKVMITVAGAALDQLEQVLGSGCVSSSRIRIVYDTLPDRAICAATMVGDVLWLVLDLDKPSANRHALAMFHETQEICPEIVERARLKGRAPLALVG